MPLPYILATGLYCFLIFENSSVADPLPPQIELPIGDKVGHMILFGGLCGVVSLGLRRSPQTALPPWAMAAIPVIFATAYGLTDEIHQFFVPGRSCEFADLLADFGGAAAMQLLLALGRSRAAP